MNTPYKLAFGELACNRQYYMQNNLVDEAMGSQFRGDREEEPN
jgi:hypothetical protein